MNTIKYRGLIASLVFLFTINLAAETLHTEEFLQGGKSFNILYVPKVIQSDRGVVIYTFMYQTPGPTFFDEWVIRELEVPFPTIAITDYISLTSVLEPNEGDRILMSWVSNPYPVTAPEFPDEFDFDKNGSWVFSTALGWIYMKFYPWIYDLELGWTYIFPTNPASRMMAYFGYSVSNDWIYFGEGFPDWIYYFSHSEWRLLSEVSPE